MPDLLGLALILLAIVGTVVYLLAYTRSSGTHTSAHKPTPTPTSPTPIRTFRLDITVRDETLTETRLERWKRRRRDPHSPDPALVVNFGQTVEAADSPSAIEKLDPIVREKWDLAMQFRAITEP